MEFYTLWFFKLKECYKIVDEEIQIIDEEEHEWPLRSIIGKIVPLMYAGKFTVSNLAHMENISNWIHFRDFYYNFFVF